MSLRKQLPHLALSLALLVGCAPPTSPTGAVSGSITSSNAESLKGATVRVLDKNGNEVGTGKTGDNGQYLVSSIPAGDVTVVVNTAQNSDQANVTVNPGRVTEVPQMAMNRSASSTVPQAVTGRIVDVNGFAVSGATVTDTTDGTVNAQTTTNSNGEFTLSVSGLNKPRNLEITKDNLVTTTTVTQDKLTGLTVTLIANARSISGTVKDAVFSDNALGGVTVKVNGTSIATTTDSNGNFTLRGVPFDRVTLQASGRDGYSAATLVQEQGHDAVTGVTLNLTPYGNLVVHVGAENAPYNTAMSLQQNVLAYPSSFKYFDINGDGKGNDPNDPLNFDPGEWIYDNYKAVRPAAFDGTIQVTGTNIAQAYQVPPAEKKQIMSRAGLLMGEVYDRNVDITTTLQGVPGGRQNIAVSLTGHTIQKSISVVIQPLETVSTDLIVLKRVTANTTVGDVVGKILGVRPEDMANVRVGFLFDGESIDMTINGASTIPGTLSLTDVLAPSNPKRVSTPDSTGRYRLFDVPTGTRLVVAGVSDGAGGFNSIYIPNTVSLANVSEGVANQAPDLTLQLR